MPDTPPIRVLATGVFDIIHPGHVWYLEQAKALGTHLTVLVTSDGHAARTKRPPLHDAAERLRLVRALRAVDDAIIGFDPYDLAAVLELAKPDIIALGYDQTDDEAALATSLHRLGSPASVARLPRLPNTLMQTRTYRL